MMNRLFKPALILFFSLACTAPVFAQSEWDGGGGADTNWTTGLNWVGDVAPNAGVAGTLTFDGNNGLMPNADIGHNGITNILFNPGAGAFTLTGSQLSIDGAGGGILGNGFISNNTSGAVTQTINNDLVIQATRLLLDAATGNLVINGNINNAGLPFATAGFQTVTVNGIISGTGDLTHDFFGEGTTAIFAGINTFTGDVDITGGLLRLDGDFANTVAVNVDAGAIFELGGDDTIGSIEGLGTIDVNAFTLTVGDGTSTDFEGVIEGTGGLTKEGTGTLTLSGVNTFTGLLTGNAGTVLITGDLDDTVGVTVGAGGTVTLGVDQTIGPLAGLGNLVLNANNLTAGDATDSVFGGVMSGTGMLIKQGAGMLTLGGVNTFTGDTQVNGGQLAITGSVAGDVTNASIVSGTGTIGGNLTNIGGSTTAPGTIGTIGTLNVNTNVIHNPGAILAGDISKDGGNAITNDVLNVTGTATLAAGSVINLTDLMGGGVFAPGDVLTLITTGGGVIDNGVVINFAAPNFIFAPTVNGNNLDAVALVVGTFRDEVTGTNNLAIARAIDFDLPLAVGDHATFLGAISAIVGDVPAANAAAQAASPTPYASALESNMRTIHHHGSMNSNHLSLKRQGLAGLTQTAESGPVPGTMQLVSTANDPALLAWALQSQIDSDYLQDDGLEDRAHFYASVFGMVVDQDARNDFTGSNANVFGGQIGVDFKANDELTVGLMLGYDFTDIDFSNGLGSSNINTLRFGPYFSWAQDNPQKPQLYLNGSFTYGYHRVEVDRAVNFAGFAGTPSSDFDAHDISFYGELGWDFEFGDFTLTPFGSMQYTNYSTDSFSEVGGAALNFPSGITVESLRTLFGGRVRGVHQIGDLFFATEGFLAWGHEFLNDDDITASFVGGTNTFSIDPNEGAADSAYFGVGLSGLLTESVSAYLRYEGAISADSTIHAIGLGITIAF